MRSRRDQYFRFVRRRVQDVFMPDGSYRPASFPDARLPYWIYPALICSNEDSEQQFANVVYAAARNWNTFDIFTTSSVAANLARDRHRMRPDLVKRSEEHLARFVVCDGGRAP